LVACASPAKNRAKLHCGPISWGRQLPENCIDEKRKLAKEGVSTFSIVSRLPRMRPNIREANKLTRSTQFFILFYDFILQLKEFKAVFLSLCLHLLHEKPFRKKRSPSILYCISSKSFMARVIFTRYSSNFAL